MRIALCDDNKSHLEAFKEQLTGLIESGRLESPDLLKCFADAGNLIKCVEEGSRFDIVFMDIDLDKEKNGIDYAEYLYKISPKTCIVFVTGYQGEYVEAVFMKRTNICGYLEKPVNQNSLIAIIDKITDDVNKRSIVVRQRGGVISIRHDDIYYLESVGHNVFIHTVDGEHEIYGTMQSIMENMPGEFCYPHKSYVVNFNYVKAIGKNVILKCNGKLVEIPLSKQRKKEMEEAFIRYLDDEI